MMTWRELLKNGENELQLCGIEDFRFDAFQLILSVSGFSKDSFYLYDNLCVDDQSCMKYSEYIQRRCNKEPLQYILGKWAFFDSEFFVGKGVLIPRPETEELVSYVIDIIRKNDLNVVYDLCSGSGCIGLSIAKACPFVTCYLFEYYDDAYGYSVKNRQSLDIHNAHVIKYDVLAGPDLSLPKADILISNPPYIESAEIPLLQDEVLQEPITALDGGKDGLLFYNCIRNAWVDVISDNGFIAFECGEGQARRISDLFSDHFNSEALKDIYGTERFVIGCKN